MLSEAKGAKKKMKGNHLSRVENFLDIAQGYIVLPFSFQDFHLLLC